MNGRARVNLLITLLVLVLITLAVALGGCATTNIPRRGVPGLVAGIVIAPFAIAGGVVSAFSGYDIDVVTDEATIKIREYCSQYRGDRFDYGVCLAAAHGNRDYYHLSCGSYRGLDRGKCERAKSIGDAAEKFGAGIGKSGY